MPDCHTESSLVANRAVTPLTYPSLRNASGRALSVADGRESGRCRQGKGGTWDEDDPTESESERSDTKPIKETSMSKWRTGVLCSVAGALLIAGGASTARA